ncbi:MAG TPA: FliH/SctL family protein [Xanthobacteraceae bacterium]|nr:FliH/SctL family protein [Xanthobacteraceae bacterium]
MSATAETRKAKDAEPASRPVKFLFDDEFDHGRARGTRARPTAAEHAAAMKEADAEGYRRGFADAQAEALARIEQRTAAAAEKVAAAMGEISEQLKSLEARLEAEAVEVALAVARQLAPGLIAREPVAEIERLVGGILVQVRSAPHVVVRLASNLVESASARLMKMAETRGYTGRLVLLPEPGLAADDCRIEWADGGLSRERAAIDARISEAVARYLGRGAKIPNSSDPETVP